MRYLIVIVLLVQAMALVAQEDTVFLDALEVSGEYTDGMVVTSADSFLLSRYDGRSLGEMLQESSGIYIKKYGGEGQLSTVSFRGTTSSHTRINWNGVDINSQTLGQSDFSSIPVFLFDDVDVYHGAGSALFGSGSIGGTINLGMKMSGLHGINIRAAQYLGSYGKLFSGIKTSYSDERWAGYFTGFHSQVKNDFKVSHRGTSYDQNNASSILLGFMTGASYKITGTSTLSLEVWYNRHDRELQPKIGDRDNEDALLDNNIRTSIIYKNAFSQGFLEGSVAYVDDRQHYNEGANNNLKRYIASGEAEYSSRSWWTIKAGGELTLAVPDVSSYADGTTQTRGGVYLLNEVKPIKPLSLSFNLRKPFLLGITSPLIPSLGIEWAAVNSEQAKCSLLFQAARSFRFPTLNDLYWVPGGNPELVPEHGTTIEAGLKSVLRIGVMNFTPAVNAYRSWINEMIVWEQKGDFWSPRNIRDVEINGTEASLLAKGAIGRASWRIHLSYAYNQSQDQSKLNDTDPSHGKQLAYVPWHKGAVHAGFAFGGWSASYSHAFTGMRFTELSNTSRLDAFSVANLSVKRTFMPGSHQVSVALEADNLFDVEYQNYELRATPGRNYLIKINYQFSKSRL